MNSNTSVKIEPPDEFNAGTSVNMSSASRVNGIAGNSTVSPSNRVMSNTVCNDSRNFTCLLCDIVCNSRDNLRKHLKNAHASKSYSAMSNTMYMNKLSSESTARAFSGYVNYRYTCPTCGAKFKSFRTYLTHNMSHRGAMDLEPFDEARMAALFGTGKMYMQDYMESEEGFTGTFTCNECKTDFLQRDAYAMHMMMRAMNETCKASTNLFEDAQINNNEGDLKLEENSTNMDVPIANQSESSILSGTDHVQQRCLEDVTAKVDQDEYLKSVLDKVCATDITKQNISNISNYHMDERKLCSFCTDSFVDQDSLAMHVMSDHATEMSSSSVKARTNSGTKTANTEDFLTWMSVATTPLIMSYVCKYCNETCMSRDSLALHVLTHAHLGDQVQGHSRNAYKRKSDLSETTSLLLPAKVANVKSERKLSDSSSLSNEHTTKDAETNLYCIECDIKFYAIAEYEWHKERHADGNCSSYGQPLGLTKHSGVYAPFRNKLSYLASSKRRRNSCSSIENRVEENNFEMLPKRPVSVGDFSSESLKHEECDIKTPREVIKPLTRTSVLNTINALSSSEQRIIYSVFGTNLSLNHTSTESSATSTPCSPPIDLSSTKSDSMQPNEIVLNGMHAETSMRTCDNVTSGFHKSDDQDGRQETIHGDRDKPMCKYCEILFFNKAIYYLHMGLHNVNNPWQCNICGKVCSDAVDFAAHVIHM